MHTHMPRHANTRTKLLRVPPLPLNTRPREMAFHVEASAALNLSGFGPRPVQCALLLLHGRAVASVPRMISLIVSCNSGQWSQLVDKREVGDSLAFLITTGTCRGLEALARRARSVSPIPESRNEFVVSGWARRGRQACGIGWRPMCSIVQGDCWVWEAHAPFRLPRRVAASLGCLELAGQHSFEQPDSVVCLGVLSS